MILSVMRNEEDLGIKVEDLEKSDWETLANYVNGLNNFNSESAKKDIMDLKGYVTILMNKGLETNIDWDEIVDVEDHNSIMKKLENKIHSEKKLQKKKMSLC